MMRPAPLPESRASAWSPTRADSPASASRGARPDDRASTPRAPPGWPAHLHQQVRRRRHPEPWSRDQPQDLGAVRRAPVADPDRLPPDTVGYTAAIIDAVERGAT